MPTYRIKYSLYRIDSDDKSSAKKEVCDIMKKMPEKFISIEDQFDVSRPLWKRILTGK